MKAFNIEELRLAAKRRLPRAVFDFIDGGAEDERTLRGNREAFSKVKLLRKVLVDVSTIDTGTQILVAASKLPSPPRPPARSARLARRRCRGRERRPPRHPVLAFHLGHRQHRADRRQAPGGTGSRSTFKDREYCFGLIERAGRATTR
jgi:hypothetical protein